MKMRAGLHGPDEDVRRVAAVRKAVGPEVGLMVDCLQLMSRDDALALGKRVEHLGLCWIEDPVACRDLEGHAMLADHLETPVATGEHEYGVHGFRALLDAGAADIVLIDLNRVGGVSDFMKVTELASERGVGVVNHCTPDQGIHLLAAAPDAAYVDRNNWWQPLYDERLEFDDGALPVPDRPGFGFTFADDVADRHGVDRPR